MELKICALRELYEETNCRIGKGKKSQGTSFEMLVANKQEARLAIESLEEVCTWITPVHEVKKLLPKGGFNTRFFSTTIEEDAIRRLRHDGVEASDLIWTSPSEALQKSKEALFPFPQLYILEQLSTRDGRVDYSYVKSLRQGIFKHPYRPCWIEPSSHDTSGLSCYVMPGDYMHETTNPLAIQGKLEHRGYCDSNGRVRKFIRNKQLEDLINSSVDTGMDGLSYPLSISKL